MTHVKNAAKRIAGGWHRHPGIRTGEDLTRGERAADKMRNVMGSWAFVFTSLLFLAAWMALNITLKGGTGHTFDQYPFILLNLVLSCVAALQGAILLIAAKRSDQVSSELAQHDYEADCQSRSLLETLTREFAALTAQHEEQTRLLARLVGERTLAEGAGHALTAGGDRAE